jgi:hypothetical protein
MTETSTKGGLFHRIKSQKQYKKITDSEEYKKADYHTKNKLLKEGGSELPKRFGTTYKKDAVKPKRSPAAGRKKLQHGGRTNLFEELGRVEGEPSNRNRRAEVSRIHGELNRGYKHGGRVGAAKRGFNKKILRKD